MNKLITSFLFITVFLLSACSDDEPQDSVKEIRMLVSAETGVMYAWGDDKKENPIECMLVKTEGDSEEWQPLGFNSIEGFTYIKGGWFRPYVFAYPYSPRQTCDRTGNSGR